MDQVRAGQTFALQLAQQRAVQDRTKLGRVVVDLMRNRSGKPQQNGREFFELPCSSELDEAGPRQPCFRLVWDGFASLSEIRSLRGAMEDAFIGLMHQNMEVSMVPSRGRLGAVGTRLVSALAERCRDALSQVLQPHDGAHVKLVGSLLKRLRLPIENGTVQIDPKHDPYVVHADMANIASYEFSALLYFDEIGVDFGGGQFVFYDADADRLVLPFPGRLVAFSSGVENLHGVAPLTWGSRYVMAMWYQRALRTPPLHPPKERGPTWVFETTVPVLSVLAVFALVLEMGRALVQCLRRSRQEDGRCRAAQATKTVKQF